ncbi:ABC transporter permease [Natrarchaeobius oligotrophus]|nr:ABC transporter permease subunit [Natrarchaeobius chitinivorans]
MKTVVSADRLRIRRSRAVVLGGVLFAGLCTFSAWYPLFPGQQVHHNWNLAYDLSGDLSAEPTPLVVHFFARWLLLFLSVLAALVGSGAIAGQVQSGYGRTLQTLPCSRRTVVFGTACTRAVTAGVITAIGLSAGGVTIWIRFDTIDLATYLYFSAVTIGYAMSLTVLAVGVSALVRTRLRALFLTLGPMVLAIYFGGDILASRAFRSALLVQPYQILVSGAHERLIARPHIEPYLDELNGTDIVTLESSADVPLYLTDIGVAMTMVLIPMVVLAVGTWRYNRRELLVN